MASLVTEDQKNEYSDVFNQIHDTFARPINYWKTPKRLVVASSPSYNFIYDNQEAIEYSVVPESGVFYGRILWADQSKLAGNANIREEIFDNSCRVKLKAESIGIFDAVEQIEIDGRIVQKFASSRPHGLFNIDYYTIYFKESS
jgi:hypothetical protein